MTNSNNKTDIRKQIFKNLKETGFPLEIRASSILVENGWDIINQKSYMDPTTSEQRTIDIISRKYKGEPESLGVLDLQLVIECKKSDKPWIFYLREIDLRVITLEQTALQLTGKIFRSIHLYKKTEIPNIHFGNHFGHNMKRGIIGVQAFHHGSNTDIFEASNQATKAAFDFFNRGKQYYEEFYKEFRKTCIITLYPVIVFDGRIFTVKVPPKNKEDIEEVEWVVYDFPISFKSKGLLYDKVLVDIVTVDYLDSYIKLMNKEFNETYFQLQKTFDR